MANYTGTPRVIRKEIDLTTQPATEGVTIGGAVIEATNGPVNQRVYINSKQRFSAVFGTPLKDPNAKLAEDITNLNLKNSGLYGGNILLNEFDAMYFVRASDDNHYYGNIMIAQTSAEDGRFARSFNIPTIRSSEALDGPWYDGYTSFTGTGDPGIRDYEESIDLSNGTSGIIFGALCPGDDGNRIAVSVVRAPTSAQIVNTYTDINGEKFQLIDESGRLTYSTQMGTTGLESIIPFVTGPNGFNWLWSYDDLPLEFVEGQWIQPAGTIWADLYKVNVYRAPANAARNFFDPRPEDLILTSAQFFDYDASTGNIIPTSSVDRTNVVNGGIDFRDQSDPAFDFTFSWKSDSKILSDERILEILTNNIPANVATLNSATSTIRFNGEFQRIEGSLTATQRITLVENSQELPNGTPTGSIRNMTSGIYLDITINGDVTGLLNFYLTSTQDGVEYVTQRNQEIRFIGPRWNNQFNGSLSASILRQSYWDRFTPIESFTVSNYQKSNLTGDSLFITDVINGTSDLIYIPTNTVKGEPPISSVQIEMFDRGRNSEASQMVDYSDKMKALQLFLDREKVSVDVLVNTDLVNTQLSSPDAARFIAYQREIARVASDRQDAIASIQVTGIGDNTPEKVLRSGLITNNLRAPSYAALYAGFDKFFDSTNGIRILIPKSVAGAYLMARTDKVANPWNAPAGTDRGIVDYSLGSFPNINSTEYGILYDNNINTTLVKTGFGNVMWGQKTAQTKKTALDRINVRRMLLYVENRIEKILEPFILNTENTASTRALITKLCNNFLETVLVGGGISHYNVICDETNNDPTSNTITVLVAVVPVRVVEYIEFITAVIEIGVQISGNGVVVTEG